jgi:hypothetical protein
MISVKARNLFFVITSSSSHLRRVAESVFDHTSHYDHLMSAAEEMEDVVRAAAGNVGAAAAGGRASVGALGHGGEAPGTGLRGAAAAHAAEVDEDMM